MTALDDPEYARRDVLRMVGITERQLRSWEKQGLLSPSQRFGFSELLALKTLKKLRELRVQPRQIQRALTSLKQRLSHVDQPLAQLRVTVDRGRIAVHVSGSRMEAITGQLLLDFDSKEIEKLRAFPPDGQAKTKQQAEAANAEQAEVWFQKGLALEEAGAPVQQAVAAYRKAIELNPNASGALVNLGTIAFRMRKLRDAEGFYQRAAGSDPQYALAQFNLGNLYDEQGRIEEARTYYLAAIRLNPRYADAHFNLALLCERNNEVLRAIGYWQAYLKLDSTSSWAQAARKQLDRLKRTVRTK